MDADSDATSSSSTSSPYICHTSPVNNSPLPLPTPVLSSTCAFCRRHLSSDIHTPDLEPISVCGDCKFLFLEDIEAFSPDLHQISVPASRRRYSSSDSTDTLFSHQFSQLITLARQNQPDNQSVDDQVSARLGQQSSSRTTPTGSRRFRRVFSDNDSDGFDSLYGETESVISFTRSRTLHGDADTISYSVYESDSDASVDGHSILENEIFGHPNGLDTDTDTDIDPMNVGYRWNSENEEEEEFGNNDSEWEETDAEGTPLERMTSVAQFHGLSIMNMRNVNGRRQSLPLEVERAFQFGVQERIQPRVDDLSTSFGELVTGNHVGDSLDHLEARGFENLLEHLADAENSRRGAPPASASFVDAMPCLTINEDKANGMACVICKDSFIIGAVVKQLPCYHLYHPSCIYPWLSSRNTCPLCRYELPTDDHNYEASKRSGSSEYRTRDVNDDGASLDGTAVVNEPSQVGHTNASELVGAADSSGGVDARDFPRNGWFFVAAAPIISILGMSLMLWVRANRRCQIPYRRECNQSPRRWWRLHF